MHLIGIKIARYSSWQRMGQQEYVHQSTAFDSRDLERIYANVRKMLKSAYVYQLRILTCILILVMAHIFRC